MASKRVGGAAIPDIQVSTLVRTLLVAGFQVTGAQRLLMDGIGVEIKAQRTDAFDKDVTYVFALTDQTQFAKTQAMAIERAALADGRLSVLISARGAKGQISWPVFLEILGGAVPTWRALSASFRETALTLSQNQLPDGVNGEPWFLFERAVADGFEFLLGRRVKHLGGLSRGARVGDIVCATPDQTVLVVDAKASASPFSVTGAGLRPMAEYVRRQRLRQQGQSPLGACVLVAREFKQPASSLAKTCSDFCADTSVPLACVRVSSLIAMTELAAASPRSRNGVSWRQVFCRNGLVDQHGLRTEIKAVAQQRIARNS